MKYIYVVEKGIFMDGMYYEYEEEHYASSLEKAKEYINDYFKYKERDDKP